MGRGAYQVLGTNIEIMHMESYGLSICELYFPTAFLLLLRKTAPCPILRTYITTSLHGGHMGAFVGWVTTSRTGSPRHHQNTRIPPLSYTNADRMDYDTIILYQREGGGALCFISHISKK